MTAQFTGIAAQIAEYIPVTQSPRRFLVRCSLLTGVTGKYPLAICPDRMCFTGGAKNCVKKGLKRAFLGSQD